MRAIHSTAQNENKISSSSNPQAELTREEPKRCKSSKRQEESAATGEMTRLSGVFLLYGIIPRRVLCIYARYGVLLLCHVQISRRH